jgi:hypothetical protein
MYFVFCRLYPSSPSHQGSVGTVWIPPLITLHLTNTVSPMLACIIIWWFRGTQMKTILGLLVFNPLCVVPRDFTHWYKIAGESGFISHKIFILKILLFVTVSSRHSALREPTPRFKIYQELSKMIRMSIIYSPYKQYGKHQLRDKPTCRVSTLYLSQSDIWSAEQIFDSVKPWTPFYKENLEVQLPPTPQCKQWIMNQGVNFTIIKLWIENVWKKTKTTLLTSPLQLAQTPTRTDTHHIISLTLSSLCIAGSRLPITLYYTPGRIIIMIRGSQRDIVYLGWPIAPSYMSPTWLMMIMQSPHVAVSKQNV